MTKKTQRERDIPHRDGQDASRSGDTPERTGRVEDSNEPVEADAVDDVTPNNEPEEDSDSERS